MIFVGCKKRVFGYLSFTPYEDCALDLGQIFYPKLRNKDKILSNIINLIKIITIINHFDSYKYMIL